MRTAVELIDVIVKDGVTPVLKPLGFRKSGRTYRRTTNTAVQVVNVQSSRWNSQSEASFTINLGVFFPEIHSELIGLFGWEPGVNGPNESECTIQTRIGALMPGGEDHWWKLDPNTSVEQLAFDIAQLLRGLALSWLETHSELRSAADVARGPSVVAILLKLGDRASAVAMAQRSIEESPRALRYHDWLRERGLLPPS